MCVLGVSTGGARTIPRMADYEMISLIRIGSDPANISGGQEMH